MARGLLARGAPVTVVLMAVALGACTSDSDSEDAGADGAGDRPSGSASGRPTYSSDTAGDVFELPHDQRWATVEQGRYAVRVNPSLTYEINVPDEWRVYEGQFLNSPAAQTSHSIAFVAEAPADDTWVPRHPCTDHTEKPVGPSAGDLADALRDQPVLQVSKPQPISPDGRRGLWVDVRIPSEADAAECVEGSVDLFSGGSADWGAEEGFSGRWWILNVNDERVVANAQCVNDCTHEDWRALQAMLESITFTRAG